VDGISNSGRSEDLKEVISTITAVWDIMVCPLEYLVSHPRR